MSASEEDEYCINDTPQWVAAKGLTCQYCHDPSTSPTPKGMAAPTQGWELGPLQAPYSAPVGYLRRFWELVRQSSALGRPKP